MTDPILIAEKLTVTYGAMYALDGLSFDLRPGEILGLLGPNGAGKTTLIKTLCGQITPSSGTLIAGGMPVRKGAENRKLIGLVPQDIGLYPHLTARENLSVFASMLGVPATQRVSAVGNALHMVGLEHRASDIISGFSGGMKRRINYAAAILHDPAILILDEPTAGVDIPARDAIHHAAKTLARQGMAVILVTHELEQAELLCDRILMLVSGRKFGFDTPEALIAGSFGDKRECLITLPAGAQTAALPALGFSVTEMQNVWHANLSGSASAQEILLKTLETEGITPKEIIMRKPGLTQLMHAVERGEFTVSDAA